MVHKFLLSARTKHTVKLVRKGFCFPLRPRIAGAVRLDRYCRLSIADVRQEGCPSAGIHARDDGILRLGVPHGNADLSLCSATDRSASGPGASDYTL